jgi:hypothetical protein
MNIKNILIGVAIIVLTIFVTFYGINMFFPKPQYEDFCNMNSEPKICPTVCVPLYEIMSGKCVLTECGSGCGADNINTFADSSSCEEGLKLSDQKKCEIQNGTWIRQDIKCVTTPCPQGYCDTYSACNQEYQDVLKVRARNVFFIALPLGILIIALGALVFGLESVGVGIMGGGIGTLIYGSGAYWPFSENWIRFVISLVGLVILIWIAYWANKKNWKKK